MGALGYTPRPLPPIELRLSSSNYDIGTVFLNAAPVQLQSLQVNGQKQEVQLAPDRNTYIVRDMPTTRGGTALDVRTMTKQLPEQYCSNNIAYMCRDVALMERERFSA